jgi:hypothetical protein
MNLILTHFCFSARRPELTHLAQADYFIMEREKVVLQDVGCAAQK